MTAFKGTLLLRLLLVVLGVTALGAIASGGLIARTPVTYQASAYVALVPMPGNVRTALGPDQAHALDLLYQAGPLQDDVLQRASRQLVGLTPSDVRAHVQVSAEAYTPLVQIAAHATQPDEAIAIANAVAGTWVAQLTSAYDAAFTTVEAGLTASDDALNGEISATQQAIVAGTTQCGPASGHPGATCASTAQLAALQATLTTDLRQQTQVRNEITILAIRRAQVTRIAYLAIGADRDTTVVLPDVNKILGYGIGGGMALGLLLALWLARESVRQSLRR